MYALRDLNAPEYRIISVHYDCDEKIARENAAELNMYGRRIEVIYVQNDPRPPVN